MPQVAGCRGVDCDRLEGRAVGKPETAVADAHLDVVDPERVEARRAPPPARAAVALDADHLGCELGQDRGRVAGAGADLEHPLGARSSSAWQIAATIQGWEIVCPSPIGWAESA